MQKGRGYYFKLLGWKDHVGRFYGPWYQEMVTQHMAHATLTAEVEQAAAGDQFVLYCIKNRFLDTPGGVFMGIDTVRSSLYTNEAVFGLPWIYIHDVSLDRLATRPVPLAEVRRWPGKSELLAKALRENLQWLPLREITEGDFRWFAGQL